MNYLKIFFFVCSLSVLASCTSISPDKNGLVGDVRRYGAGQYYVNGLGFSIYTVHEQALHQCMADGNRQVQIINSSFVTGSLSGDVKPALIFKCV
jgi:hypothetical protein